MQIIGLDWPRYFLRDVGSISLSDSEWHHLANFKSETSQSDSEEARDALVAAITRDFGSVGQFTAYVRTEVPAVVLAGKRRYAQAQANIAGTTLALVLGGGS